MKKMTQGSVDVPKPLYEAPIQDLWWKELILENGKLDDTKTKSEYERGFIDCWNELWEYSLYV